MHPFGELGSSVLTSLVVTLGAMAAGLHAAYAQEAAGPGRMQFFVTPYLWLSGINTTTKTPVPESRRSIPT